MSAARMRQGSFLVCALLAGSLGACGGQSTDTTVETVIVEAAPSKPTPLPGHGAQSQRRTRPRLPRPSSPTVIPTLKSRRPRPLARSRRMPSGTTGRATRQAPSRSTARRPARRTEQVAPPVGAWWSAPLVMGVRCGFLKPRSTPTPRRRPTRMRTAMTSGRTPTRPPTRRPARRPTPTPSLYEAEATSRTTKMETGTESSAPTACTPNPAEFRGPAQAMAGFANRRDERRNGR
jgi:hypothetical protein